MRDLKPEDITSEVCQHCGYCCGHNNIFYSDVNEDLKNFYLAVYGEDCVEIKSKYIDEDGITRYNLFLSKKCPHLTKDNDGLFICDIYEKRPQHCSDFNCVMWAIVNNYFVDNNHYLEHARQAINSLKNKHR